MLAFAFLVASACGTAVIVTVLGLGARLGAVYVALSAIGSPPAPCVVTVLSVPQDAPLHPVPERDQVKTVLGCEPGTGVMVATIVAAAPDGRLGGAVSCRLKLLVRLMVAEACFAESATLIAVTVTLEAAGRLPGAV